MGSLCAVFVKTGTVLGPARAFAGLRDGVFSFVIDQGFNASKSRFALELPCEWLSLGRTVERELRDPLEKGLSISGGIMDGGLWLSFVLCSCAAGGGLFLAMRSSNPSLYVAFSFPLSDDFLLSTDSIESP